MLLLLCAFGCDDDSTSSGGLPASGLPAGEPAFTGTITSVGASSIRVEENPADDWGSSKADLRLTGSTRVLNRDGSPASAAQLAVGQTVQVWITGPVAASYPVQATADVVVIAAPVPSQPRSPKPRRAGGGYRKGGGCSPGACPTSRRSIRRTRRIACGFQASQKQEGQKSERRAGLPPPFDARKQREREDTAQREPGDPKRELMLENHPYAIS